MATYTELYGLMSNSTLRNRVAVACIIAAEAIRTEAEATANHANRLIWAKQVFESPEATANSLMMGVLAANNGLTVAQITGATDAAILAAVQAEINVFATGA